MCTTFLLQPSILSTIFLCMCTHTPCKHSLGWQVFISRILYILFYEMLFYLIAQPGDVSMTEPKICLILLSDHIAAHNTEVPQVIKSFP